MNRAQARSGVTGSRFPVCGSPLAGDFIRATLLAALLGWGLAQAARAEWQQTGTSLAWAQDGQVVWRYNFDAAKGKPFFQPLATRGTDLTMFQPEDHPWHYALWFSWKYINGANYWEEDRATGKAEGRTRWSQPEVKARRGGEATILMDVDYVHPSGRVDLAERRRIEVSRVGKEGGYTIDWTAEFMAGPAGAVLDRTPMPGEPDGRVNGGYAGLSVRLAPPPLVMKMVTSAGAVDQFVQNRARPNAPAAAANFLKDNQPVGGIAFLSAKANAGENAPWYLIDNNVMRFMCSAVLAPAVKKLGPGEKYVLRYRIAVRGDGWTPVTLRAAWAQWDSR